MEGEKGHVSSSSTLCSTQTLHGLDEACTESKLTSSRNTLSDTPGIMFNLSAQRAVPLTHKTNHFRVIDFEQQCIYLSFLNKIFNKDPEI